MTNDITKEAVVKSYSNLAKTINGNIVSKLFGCCDFTNHTQDVASAIGYSSEEINVAPQESNLGVGCGNPSAQSDISLGDTVVDLGSGAGFDAFIVSKEVGPTGHVIGVDLSDDMLKLAIRNAAKGNYQNTSFIKGDIENLPIDEGIADHVISNCVINLSTRKDKVYKEAYRVLKPGGKICISDIVLERELPSFIKNSLAGHIACVSGAETIETYLDHIRRAGFKNIEVLDEKAFPLELMLLDPQVAKMAQKMKISVNSEQAKDIASRVKSITVVATK